MSGVCVSEGDIGELGCSQSHHCTGGAVCYQRRCVCPEGYTTTASATKCAKRGGKRHLDYSFRFSLEFGIIFLWMQSTKITVCVKYLGGFIVSIRQSVREKNDHTVFLQLDDINISSRSTDYRSSLWTFGNTSSATATESCHIGNWIHYRRKVSMLIQSWLSRSVSMSATSGGIQSWWSFCKPDVNK